MAKAPFKYNCRCLKTAAEVVVKVGFKMFLGVAANTSDWNKGNTAVTIIIQKNPLTGFVQIPKQHLGLHYCNIFCGILRGALNQLKINVECHTLHEANASLDSDEHQLRLAQVDIAGLAEVKS